MKTSKKLKKSELQYLLRKQQEKNEMLVNEIEDMLLKEQVISTLLSAQPENKSAQHYFEVLEKEFLPFANNESSLKEEAKAVLITLQEIGVELNLVASEPEFYKKQTVAIAGGFSAGKSEFINSLLEIDTLRLPSGIQPTTAIPTYVMNIPTNNDITIHAFNHKGAKVDLLKISPDFYQKLSHQFIEMFKFNLREIMPSIFISAPMKFKHLCFIDTPGYNPSNLHTGFTSGDIDTAKEYSDRADVLIWLIGLDANGTISKTDLDFLSKLFEKEQNKKLYVVLNKADLRPKSNIDAIMEEVADALDDYGIEFEGISAYSSISKLEISHYDQSLFDFFNSINKESDKRSQLLDKLFSIDEQYQRAMLMKKKEYKQMLDLIKEFELDPELYPRNLFKHIFGTDKNKDNKEKLIEYFSYNRLDKQLKRLSEVTFHLETAINTIFNKQEESRRHRLTLRDI